MSLKTNSSIIETYADLPYIPCMWLIRVPNYVSQKWCEVDVLTETGSFKSFLLDEKRYFYFKCKDQPKDHSGRITNGGTMVLSPFPTKAVYLLSRQILGDSNGPPHKFIVEGRLMGEMELADSTSGSQEPDDTSLPFHVIHSSKKTYHLISFENQTPDFTKWQSIEMGEVGGTEAHHNIKVTKKNGNIMEGTRDIHGEETLYVFSRLGGVYESYAVELYNFD